MHIAEVFINIPIKSIAKAYSYRIPPELDFLDSGWRVIVPFGGRSIEGFIVKTFYAEESEVKLKDIISTMDQEPWFMPEVIEAARWMSEYYLCSQGEMMRLFMPGKSGIRISACYSAVAGMEDHMLLMVDSYRRIYELLLAKGPQQPAQLKREMPDARDNIDMALEKLLRYGLVSKEYQGKLRAKEQIERFAVLIKPFAEEDKLLFYRKKAQLKLLELLSGLSKEDKPGEISFRELGQEKISIATVKALAEAGWVEIQHRRRLRDSYRDFRGRGDKVLEKTSDQKQVISEISRVLCNPDRKGMEQQERSFLLFGVTGSGKTLVYIEAARMARQEGRNVIVLVPEIALTGQLVQAFKDYFADDIIVMHSRLSISERNDAIVRVRQGEAGIIIGARSALFTPVVNIGLIIMDEEQDNSYKQDEAPRYHARVVADALCRIHKAVLLLGSATPSMETYYGALNGSYKLLRMPKRIGSRPLPEVSCADMRLELKAGRRNIMSLALRELLTSVIGRGEQAIIMLNRRGFSTFVMCRSCGEAIRCPKCGLPMVYHRDGRLMCHHCDIYSEVPAECPKCKSRYIKYFGSGTEKLEEELARLLPNARVIRMDRDTTAGKHAHRDILDAFRRHEYDILLGTQMVAKGHDIPDVTAVGIISADSALHIPDFRASERVFMLITQTAGRAGRGKSPGRVIVQSYQPEHYAVDSGIKQDYEGFFNTEIEYRQSVFYPPFARLVKLVSQHKNKLEAFEMAFNISERFHERFQGISGQVIQGPIPAMIEKFGDLYRFCLLIKTNDLTAVQSFLREEGVHLNDAVVIDIDPISTT